MIQWNDELMMEWRSMKDDDGGEEDWMWEDVSMEKKKRPMMLR